MTNSFASAVAGPDGRPLDQIRITGVSGHGRHGVLDSERATGQEFRADVVLHVDTRTAAQEDDLRATVSYADVAAQIHDVLVGEPARLVETLAERIAAVTLTHEPVQAVDVSVHKPQAPIPVAFDDVEVAIRRDRVAAPPVVAPAVAASRPTTPVAGEQVAPDPLDLSVPAVSDEGLASEQPPLSGEALVVPEIDPVHAAPEQYGAPASGADTAENAVTEQQGTYEPEFAGQADPPFQQAEPGQPEGMIDAVPSTDSSVPAFEPHVDAPARPADDDETIARPAYDPASHPAAAFVAGAAAGTGAAAAAAQEGEPGAPEHPAVRGTGGPEQPEAWPQQQFSAEHEQYAPDQQYPAEQQYAPDQQFAPEQQYPAEQQFAPEQQYPAEQHQAERQYPVDPGAAGNGPADRLDETPAEPVQAILALGANLGDPQATLRAAVLDLDRIAGLRITEVSPLARTAAVGGPEQPDYLNAVVVAETKLSPRGLLHACQGVEYSHGRTRDEHWGPRTLDIDIITYGQITATADDLEVPHPRAHERAFVLEPWSQLKPDAVLPGLGGGPVAQLAATATDRQGIRWLALDWLTESNSGADPTGDVEPQQTASHAPYNPPSAEQAQQVQPQYDPNQQAHAPEPSGQEQVPDASYPQQQDPFGQQPGHPPQQDVYPQQGGYPQQDGYPQQQGGFAPPEDRQQQDGYPRHDAYQQPDSAGTAAPQYPVDQVPYAQPQSSQVPPQQEAQAPFPPGADPHAPAPQAGPAPVVPQAVRETAHHEIPEHVPDPAPTAQPLFAPVRPQPGDAPFAPVYPGPNDQQHSADEQRPAWAPVRSEENGHPG